MKKLRIVIVLFSALFTLPGTASAELSPGSHEVLLVSEKLRSGDTPVYAVRPDGSERTTLQVDTPGSEVYGGALSDGPRLALDIASPTDSTETLLTVRDSRGTNADALLSPSGVDDLGAPVYVGSTEQLLTHAFNSTASGFDIFLFDARDTLRQPLNLTPGGTPRTSQNPTTADDGSSIAFAGFGPGEEGIYVLAAGSQTPTRGAGIQRHLTRRSRTLPRRNDACFHRSFHQRGQLPRHLCEPRGRVGDRAGHQHARRR